MSQSEKLDQWRFIRKMLDNELSESEKTAFWQRYDSDADFRRETDDYIASDINVELNGLFSEPDEAEEVVVEKPIRQLSYKTLFRVAASVVVILALGFIYLLFFNTDNKRQQADNKSYITKEQDSTQTDRLAPPSPPDQIEDSIKNDIQKDSLKAKPSKTNDKNIDRKYQKKQHYAQTQIVDDDENLTVLRDGFWISPAQKDTVSGDSIYFSWNYDKYENNPDSLTIILWNFAGDTLSFKALIKNEHFTIPTNNLQKNCHYYYEVTKSRKSSSYRSRMFLKSK